MSAFGLGHERPRPNVLFWSEQANGILLIISHFFTGTIFARHVLTEDEAHLAMLL